MNKTAEKLWYLSMQVEIGGAHIGLPADLTLETLGLSERGRALVNHQDVISEWDG